MNEGIGKQPPHLAAGPDRRTVELQPKQNETPLRMLPESRRESQPPRAPRRASWSHRQDIDPSTQPADNHRTWSPRTCFQLMPRIVLAQVKRQMLRFQHFVIRILLRDSVACDACGRRAVASTKADSWLKWTVSFDEESRPRHIPAEGDR